MHLCKQEELPAYEARPLALVCQRTWNALQLSCPALRSLQKNNDAVLLHV